MGIIPRVGMGNDFHAFADASSGRELYLAGLHWPGEVGLTGHSDGDVAAHAACDALFAAAGLGDLGRNFGVDRPQWADASGVLMLSEAARRVRAAGFEIGNITVQVIGSKPRMQDRLAEASEVLTAGAGADVQVSATTTDGLGFAGRGEGLAATAVALVYPRPVRTGRRPKAPSPN